jgi:hypothetical protein
MGKTPSQMPQVQGGVKVQSGADTMARRSARDL